MSNKTRKRFSPTLLVMSLAVVGVLAAFIALAAQPGTSEAHGAGDHGSIPACAEMSVLQQGVHDAVHALNNEDGCPDASEDTSVDVMPRAMIDSNSTSASGGVELTFITLPLTAADVAKIGVDGGSVELFLEDDFVVPDSISSGSIYFTLTKPMHRFAGGGGRVRATYGVEVNDGDFFGGDDDWAIQVYLPDLYTASVDDAAGFQGPRVGQTLTMVVTKSAGIKNPSEEGTHSVGYKFLGPTDDADKDGEMSLGTVATYAKIGLSDEDNVRGYELTVTGSGFNNATTASAHVLAHARYEVAKWWNGLDCTGMKEAMGSESNKFCFNYVLNAMEKSYSISPTGAHDDFLALDGDEMKMYSDMVFAEHLCGTVIMDGTEVGSALVGSDDKAAVTFEVTSPTFQPGNINYICMKDGENRQSSTDVEVFHLEPSIRVVPSTVSSGDTVNLFAQDYPFSTQSLTELKLAGIVVYNNAGTNAIENLENQSLVNGSAAISFEIPGSVNDSPLQGTVRVDARWGTPGTDGKCNADDDSNCTSEDSKITVTGSELTASVTDVLPNETITITGNGYGSQACVAVGKIQLDGVAVQVDEESTFTCRDGDYKAVEVSNSGQFVATITLWPADTSGNTDNPTLISGTHALKVEDSKGFIGSTTLMIAEPTISVIPEVVGPRDYVVITGTNWPIDNPDNSNADLVDVVISDDARGRKYSVYPDNTGRFIIEHRVSKDVAIPSTNQVKGSHSDVVKVGSFKVPAATVTVTPNQAQPGDTVSLSATDMKPYAEADYVKIGGTSYNDPGANTDIDGNITIDDVLVPGLDPGIYSVIIDVDGTVAIGDLEVLAEDSAAGAGAELPGALEELDDTLVRVFHFNDVDKSWDFFDPRDEFAELNTLTTLVNGEPYWVLVSEGQEDVVLNNRARTLTCVGGDCWNQIVW